MICENCGWIAANCGLSYLVDSGDLARNLEDPELAVEPGCEVCYQLQVLGKMDLLTKMRERREHNKQILEEMVGLIKVIKSYSRELERLIASSSLEKGGTE